MLTLLHPLMAIGVAGAAVPVVIHLLTRPRPRQVRLPTVHLLLEAGGGRQALDRLRTWLVLAARALAVAALAMVFSRPFFAAGAAQPGTGRKVVLLVDASLSMQASRGGVTLFDTAKAQAAGLLRGLEHETGSQAAVILAGARPQAVLPALSANLAVLHQGLEAARPTLEKGDPQAALVEAQRLLGGSGTVYVFSDLQRSDWGAVDFRRLGGLQIFLRPVCEAPVENLGLTRLELSPATPVEGESVELTATLFNSSPRNRQEVVRLDLAGVGQTAPVGLAPYASAEVRFTFNQPAARLVAGSVSIAGDALPGDDRRFFTLDVRPTLEALLLSEAGAQDRNQAAFYLSAALAPSAGAGTGLAVQVRHPQAAERSRLETSDLFVLSPPVTLAGPVAEILCRRILDGALAVVVLDGGGAAPLATILESTSQGRITMPFTLGPPVLLPAAGEGRLSPAQPLPAVLRLFAGAGAGDLTSLSVRRHLKAERLSGRNQEGLLFHADGTVAVALSPAGRGLVLWLNLPMTPDGGDLMGSPLLPALLHELVKGMRRGESGSAAAPGQPWYLEVSGLPAEADLSALELLAPDGTRLAGEPLTRGRSVRLAMPAVSRPGQVNAVWQGAPLAMAAVNVDSRETDTRAIDPQAIIEADDPGAARVAVISDDGRLVQAGKPWSLWPALLLIGALALAVEMGLLAFWPRRTGRLLSGRAV